MFVVAGGLVFDVTLVLLLVMIVGKAELLFVVGDSIHALRTVDGLLPPIKEGGPDVAINTVSARLPSEFILPALRRFWELSVRLLVRLVEVRGLEAPTEEERS